MADLAKSMPVVSSPTSMKDPPVCHLNELTDPPTSPNGLDTFALPESDDCTSLQDLIDSELALRISVDVPDDDTTESEEPLPFVGKKQEVQYGNYRLREDNDFVAVPNGKEDTEHEGGRVSSPEADTTAGLVSPHSEACDVVVDINTKFIMNEQSHGGVGELTEADILFFNTFNQVQSNGDEFLSSPEVENLPVVSPTVDDGRVLTGFDPFATIPAQDLESPVFEVPKPFPPNEPERNVGDVAERNVFVTNDKDLDEDSEIVANICEINHVDSFVDFDNRMDVDNVVELVSTRGPEICSESREASECGGVVQEVEGHGPDVEELLTVEGGGDLLTPESVQIPSIGVTPPEPGTEYDEDAYYAQLESRPPFVEAGVDTSPSEDSQRVAEFVEQGEDLDSWVKVDDVEFDRSEEETRVAVDPEPHRSATDEVAHQESHFEEIVSKRSPIVEEIALEQPRFEEIPTDQSQAGDPVEHATVDQSLVCINGTESDSENSEAVTSSSSAEKKPKKKKSGEGGESKIKRNKKGKENISVNVASAVSPTNLAATPVTPSEILLEDAQDLSNVSVKELRRSFGDLTNLVDKEELQTSMDLNKSSFSKFDALQKKTVLHVRSADASKAQKQFSQSAPTEVSSNCKICGKQAFQMEQVKAERSVYHKNCFRCQQCSKQLTVDTYSSHEGQVYCKPHFKELFQPKVVIEDEEPVRRRRPEMIIRENQPMELPPDVVRGSDKPDLGLEELGSLNVKSRFQVFEKGDEPENPIDKSPSAINVKRSPSILSKLARFQAKGMDVGVTDDSLNGIPLVESSSSEESEEEEEDTDKEVVRANRKQRERPVSFSKMEDIKGRWETGTTAKKEVRREERKHEIQTIRSRLFMGHQGKMKEMYQQAVSDSANTTAKKEEKVDVGSTRAQSIKERFERGEPLNVDDEDGQAKKLVDEDLVDSGYSKKSRSLFLELDATASKQTPISPAKPPVGRNESFKKSHEIIFTRTPSTDVVKASDQQETVQVQTADIGNKFKFFEKYQPSEKEKKAFRITPPRDGVVKEKTPEREIYRDPTIVRSDERPEEGEITRSQTASKMLSFFKHMEQSANKEDLPQGPKPLKRFTPPPDSELNRDSESSEEESSEEEEEDDDEHDPNIIRASDKQEDEFLKQTATAARAKALRAKFERWEEKEIEREKEAIANGVAAEPADQSDQASIDTTRTLRARFESMNSEQSPAKDKQARPKVNRFV